MNVIGLISALNTGPILFQSDILGLRPSHIEQSPTPHPLLFTKSKYGSP